MGQVKGIAGEGFGWLLGFGIAAWVWLCLMFYSMKDQVMTPTNPYIGKRKMYLIMAWCFEAIAFVFWMLWAIQSKDNIGYAW